MINQMALWLKTTLSAQELGGHGFDCRATQIGQSLAVDSSPLRCFVGPVLPRRSAALMGLAARHMFRRNTSSEKFQIVLSYNFFKKE